ncbi:MAG: CopG family ribbon-helix-helix protein [Candidatus Thermoplasmatota archaeon]|nr:CopG family ribbon-helix-helix protein [Candidatus Thermoplasmatota archaeon]
MPVVSVSIPSSLLDRLKEVIDEEGYASRSEIVRESIRNYLEDYSVRKNLSGELKGFISIMYDVTNKTCSGKISDIHHENDELVEGSLHLHFEEGNCFDIWIVEGEAERLMKLLEKLKTVRGTKHVGRDLVSD